MKSRKNRPSFDEDNSGGSSSKSFGAATTIYHPQTASQSNGPHLVAAPSTITDIVLGVATQLARKYLFINPCRRAMFYLIVVFLLSMVGEFMSLPDHYYLVKKNNIFNQYGTKLGWFWTCLFLVPFIWLTSISHHGSRTKAFKDLVRLVVATFLWNFCTNAFVKVERHTGVCHGAEHALRDDCSLHGGKWIPGFDISGHTFILLYSILLIGEEVSSFRNWPSNPRTISSADPNRHYHFQNYRTSMKIIQVLFVALCGLHILWDVQLVVTLLYYHTISHKVMGALIALWCWWSTYHLWYPLAFPFTPIRRHSKTFD